MIRKKKQQEVGRGNPQENSRANYKYHLILSKGNIKNSKVFFVKNISAMMILKTKRDKERYNN